MNEFKYDMADEKEALKVFSAYVKHIRNTLGLQDGDSLQAAILDMKADLTKAVAELGAIEEVVDRFVSDMPETATIDPQFDSLDQYVKAALYIDDWIPVTRALPPTVDEVLFYTPDLRNPTEIWSGSYNGSNGTWWSAGYEFCNVTHWKPRPATPKARHE